ncbi:MAG TPA: radical SAM protein [Polyangia bacterium]|nr:radical SAM protein [Polyangia bacterium]
MSNNIAVDTTGLGAGFGESALKLFARARSEHLPIAGGIELTHRCNLACLHCYVNLPAADREAQRAEMTTDEVKSVIDQIADAGTLYLTFSGGEPLLRPDFPEVYRHAHARGLIVTVYTNATLISKAIVDLFVECPPRLLEVTQYGYTPETYDRVTDAGEQYGRFMRGLERVRAAGVKVTLKAVAMRANRDEVLQIRDFARREGMRFRFDTILSPRIDGGKKPLAQRLTPEEVIALETGDQERQKEFADYCHHTGMPPQGNDSKYHCGAGLATFLVDPYGRMHVCELSRKPGWDVVRGGFARGWYEEFPKLRALKRQHTDGCGTCGGVSTCSNCVGMAELEGMSSDDGNLYMCRVNDKRMESVFGANRPEPNGLVRLRLAREQLLKAAI